MLELANASATLHTMTLTSTQVTTSAAANMTLNQSLTDLTSPPTNTSVPQCVIGAVVPAQAPVNLSIFRNFPAPSQPPSHPQWEVGLKIAFYVMSFLVSVTGNTLVVVVIVSNKRMRSTTNILLLNQAVADVMVAAVCMWVHLGNSITPEWPFGPLTCKVDTFCQVVAVTASVLTLTAISVERFQAIVFPLRGHWTGRTCSLLIALTWLAALVMGSPQLFVRRMYQQQWRDRHEVYCAEEWPQVYEDADCNTWQPGKVVYYSIEAIVMYFVPVLIMVAAYSLIAVRLVMRKVPGVSTTATISPQDRAKRKVIKMLVAVLVCFVVCWTPQQLMLLYEIFRPYDKVPEYVNTVKYVSLFIAYLNSALNPILYGGFNDNFRRGFRDLFHCILARKNNRVHPEGVRIQGRAEREVQGNTGRILPDSRPMGTQITPVEMGTGTRIQQTNGRLNLTESARTAAVFGDPHLPSSAFEVVRRHSVQSDDTTHIAWQALR